MLAAVVAFIKYCVESKHFSVFLHGELAHDKHSFVQKNADCVTFKEGNSKHYWLQQLHFGADEWQSQANDLHGHEQAAVYPFNLRSLQNHWI